MSRWRLLRAAEPDFPVHVLGNQIHRTAVAWHGPSAPGWIQVDGLDGHGTATAGLMLYVTVADCVPIYLVDPVARVVALLHAGWRGVAGRILERGVEILSHNANVNSADIVMHCGISICYNCYEVGSEVIDALRLVSDGRGKAQADLPAILADQARGLGIPQVSSSPLCSAHDRDRFFSHRASRGTDGRMVAYLGIPGRPVPAQRFRDRQG
jgi:YfiH family protein